MKHLFQIAHVVIREQQQTNLPGFWQRLFVRLGAPAEMPMYRVKMTIRLTRMERDLSERFGHVAFLKKGMIVTIENGTRWMIVHVDFKAWDLEVVSYDDLPDIPKTEAYRLCMLRVTAQATRAK